MSPEEIKFWEEVAGLLNPETPPLVIEYRLYYNSEGDVITTTMIDDPVLADTPYVVVTKDIYEKSFNYRVVNKQPVLINRDTAYRVRLKQANAGYQVVKNHAGLILEPSETFNDTEYYEPNN